MRHASSRFCCGGIVYAGESCASLYASLDVNSAFGLLSLKWPTFVTWGLAATTSRPTTILGFTVYNRGNPSWDHISLPHHTQPWAASHFSHPLPRPSVSFSSLPTAAPLLPSHLPQENQAGGTTHLASGMTRRAVLGYAPLGYEARVVPFLAAAHWCGPSPL
jgi:hypothetical protein